jgi:coenzyme F420-0:L-glutamate ligase/coenzyme F420-1:gamma-L-glutamate ligase
VIAEAAPPDLRSGDALCIAHKVVSKVEGRTVRLADVVPGARASALADEHGKDARLVELVLSECVELVRAERGVLVCRTRHGLVCANAGVDVSFGRAWRLGQVDVALGAAGVVPLDDWRGRRDAHGRDLRATAIAVADAVAAAADLARAKDSGEPAVLVRGLGRFVTAADGPGAAALRRPREEDLFT